MHIKKLFAVALAAASSCLGFSQLSLDFSNIQNGAANREDNATAVTYDAAGNTYITGNSQYNLAGGFRSAVWTMKLDNSGVIVWSKLGRAGLTGENDFPKAIALDGLGNTYVVAEGNQTATDSRILLIKYDTAGNIAWSKFFTPQSGKRNVPVGLGIDSSNRCTIGGTAGFGSSTSDYTVAQFSVAGALNWNKEFNLSGGTDDAAGVKVLSNGDVVIAGTSQPASGSGAATSWIVKYNAAGVKQFDNGITNNPAVIYETHGLAVGPDNSIVVTGTEFPVDSELFVAKFSPTGVYQWGGIHAPTSSIGFADQIGGRAAAVGADGSVYVTGAIANTDGYFLGTLVKWNSAGVFQYGKTFGGSSNQTVGNDIKVDAFGRVYIAYENSAEAFSYRQAGVVTYNGVSGAGIAFNLVGNGSTLNKSVAVDVDAKGRIYMAGTSKIVPGTANFLTQRFIQPMVVFNHGYSLKVSTSTNIDAAHGVINNARYFVDGTAVLLTSPAHGSLTFNPNGSFLYTPTPGYTGPDSFTFKGLQRGMSSNVGTVNLTVNP